MKKYICDSMCFIAGRRYRAGEVFELPDDIPPAPSMTLVKDETEAKTVRSKRAAKQKSTPKTLAEMGKADAEAMEAAFKK